MRKALLPLLLLVLFASSCRKKTWADYYQLEGQQSVLVARDGEAAYESEEMAKIIAALQAAPENAREQEKAAALAARLSAERDRVKAARAALLAAKVDAPSPQPYVPSEPTPTAEPGQAPPAEAVQDAGAAPTYPVRGMSETDFLAAFGKCFTPGPAVTAPGDRKARSQQVKPDADCRARYANGEKATTEVLFVFLDGKLDGTRSTEIVDAGMTVTKVLPPPSPPVYLDAGTVPVIAIPGMPSAPPPEEKK